MKNLIECDVCASKQDLLRLPTLANSDAFTDRMIAAKYTKNNDILTMLSYDFNATVRLIVAQRANEETLFEMVNDECSKVRAQVALRIDERQLHLLVDDKDVLVRCIVAQRADQELLLYMLDDTSKGVRGEAAKRINSMHLLRCLHDKDEYVRNVAKNRLKK